MLMVGITPAQAAVAPPGATIPNTATLSSVLGNAPPVVGQSNRVVITVLGDDHIGVSKLASQPYMNIDANGASDGTATVRFHLRVKSYATLPLYQIAVNDVLEGTGANHWGGYTPSTVPGRGQYTVVPNSLGVFNVLGTGTQVNLSTAFTGQAKQSNLLGPGSVLPAGGEFTLQFDIRFDLGNLPGTVYNQAQSTASITPSGPSALLALSTFGPVPDANGDGNPTNDASPTPMSTALPALGLTVSATPPLPTETPGIYQFDYSVTVSNKGTSPAAALQLIDSLDCAFHTGQPNAPVSSWSLVGVPVSLHKILTPSTSYTGKGGMPCPAPSGTALTVPQGAGLNLVDGQQSLPAGQTETITVTVRVALSPGAALNGAMLNNTAWAAAPNNGNGLTPAGSLPPVVPPPPNRAQSRATTQTELPTLVAMAYGSASVFITPVAPNPMSMTLQKQGSTSQAELGDMLDYTLTLLNTGTHALSGVTIRDQLPSGLRYVPGSARISKAADANDNGTTFVPLADPAGGQGPVLNFANNPAFQLAPKQSVSVRYRVKIGPGVPRDGVAVNKAQARADGGVSNEAAWRVKVGGGVMSDAAFAFGKVFLDCNRDGLQSEGELGVPGVRLMLEDGTSVITDVEGKWSLYGLRPVTHALKIDTTSLPKGAHLALLSNRQSGAGDSVFLDLKNGEWHKANFALDNCGDQAMVDEVLGRRKAIAERPQLEGLAGQLNTRLDPKGQVPPLAQANALPASGELGLDGSIRADTVTPRPLIDLPSGGTGANGMAMATTQSQAFNPVFRPEDVKTPDTDPLTPELPAGESETQSHAGHEALEDQIADADNSLAFLGLQDGAVLNDRLINVRIKGSLPGQINLKVNGEPVPDNRVGKKATLESKDLWAVEFIGISLRSGLNTLEAESADTFGNVRERVSLQVTAPGPLARIELKAPESAKADGKTPVKVTVRLTDEHGVPIHTRTQITLEKSAGVWNVKDLSPTEPGVQTFVQGGEAELEFIPPSAPGDGRLSVRANLLSKQARMAFLPDLRPLTGIGIVEGVLDLSKRGPIALGTSSAGAFESEINSFSTQSGHAQLSARTAFFFKGTILGEYLLTTAYDSDKPKNQQMLRDIRPDQFYPVYGDSSVKTFDAQSTGKLYVRVDKNRSFLLYGDFVTTSSPEVRQLSQINRAVSGLRHQFEDKDMRISSYISRDTLSQQIQEFPANGTSGPFTLPGLGDMVVNSETVEILVRDARQMQTVLKTTVLTRFVDYTVEPISKTLLFTSPIRTFDPDTGLNPQSIRVSYSVDSGGAPYWVAGSDAQFRVNDHLQLGAVVSTDSKPDDSRKLVAGTALARIDDKTTLSSEVVKTQSDLKGEGQALRVELRRQDSGSNALVQLSKTSEFFDNPNATIGAGKTVGNLKFEHRLDDKTQLKAEALYNGSSLGGVSSTSKGAAVSVQQRLGEDLVGEIGLRTGQQSSPTAASFSYGSVSSGNGVGGPSMSQANVASSNLNFTSVRGRLSSKLPGVPEANVFVEAEQGLNQADKRALTVGGNYQLSDTARVYGRYALISSLYNNPYDANTTVQNNVGLLGVETAYMEGGRFFNEYRMVDTIDGRAAQAATGLRNTFKLTEQLRGTAGVEHTGALGGVPGLGSTAYTGGLEYLVEDRLRATGTVEVRHGNDSSSTLSTLGVALKLDRDWSLLARSIVSDVNSSSGNSHTRLQRQQVGFAYRPVDQDLWNLIGRYEHRLQDLLTASPGLATSAQSTTESHIVALQANVQPRRDTLLSTRYAVKWGQLHADGLRSSSLTQLIMGRLTRDLNARWDLGLQAGLAWSRGGGRQLVLGAEGGYQLMPNLWMSGGYNFLGLKDPDLGGSNFTSKGPYVRMRFKFDENTIAPRLNSLSSAMEVAKP